MKVAMIAPPWLAMPVRGYGGIERVVQNLVLELADLGVEVEVFANGQRRLKGVKTHAYYKKEVFDTIDLPYYDAPLQIMQTHLNFALKQIEQSGDFDIIHDHNPYIGPTYFALATRITGIPPVLHTFHGPPFSGNESISSGQYDNRPQLELLNLGKLYMSCISDAMAEHAPEAIKPHLLPAIHNAIEVEQFPYMGQKSDYYITLARFTRDKGQALAVRFAAKYKKRLRMAGTVAGITTSRKLLLELANPLSHFRANEEFQYYSDEILQYVLRYPRITYAGNLGGKKKDEFVARAKALLFPIQWDEPFGMAVIEALASGTPVVAMNRGAMPEIIQHGVNGFLANTEQEFQQYALRVDEINPLDCRKSVEKNFSARKMAKAYIKHYQTIIKQS